MEYDDGPTLKELLEEWCEKHLGKVVPITCKKDFHMWKLYDDRAVQVEPNTGRILGVEI